MPYLKKALFIFTCLFICHISRGQTANLSTADSLYNIGNYKQASNAYINNFKVNPQDTTDAQALYHTAIACTKVKYIDSAYRYLFMMTTNHLAIKYFDDILYGTAFQNIRNDKQWTVLNAEIEKFKRDYNNPISVEFTETGRARLAVESGKDSVLNRDGGNFKLIRRYTDSIRIIDSINNLKFKTIINTYGWIGPGNVGKEGFRWLIYLYKKLPTVTQKSYFSFIVSDFKDHQLPAIDYAIIADRISLFDTGKQIYGTQAGQPIENSKEVDARRQSIGLYAIYHTSP